MKLLLYIAELYPCGSKFENMTSIQDMGKLIATLDFQPWTKECLKKRLFTIIHDLLCGENREELFKRTMMMAERWFTENNYDKNFLKVVKALVEYLWNSNDVFESICRKNATSWPHNFPMREKRQFGLMDTLHTMKSIFCDDQVLSETIKEMQRRHDEYPYLLEVVGNLWCCLVTGEWEEIIKWERENGKGK